MLVDSKQHLALVVDKFSIICGSLVSDRFSVLRLYLLWYHSEKQEIMEITMSRLFRLLVMLETKSSRRNVFGSEMHGIALLKLQSRVMLETRSTRTGSSPMQHRRYAVTALLFMLLLTAYIWSLIWYNCLLLFILSV